MSNFLKKYGLFLSLAILIGIVSLPTPEGLPVAGHRMLALLVFSVILWMTECVSYPASAAIILSLMVVLLGFSPNVAKPAALLGTGPALSAGLKGFSNTAWALVGAALFLSIAMTKTGLDRRIALNVLSLVGAKTNRILIGVILTGFALSFFVPSTTARVACMVPIVMGIVSAFGVEKKTRFASILMIATAQADSIWNVGIKTAAAQNMIATNFIKQILGVDIGWMDWFVAAAPFAILMSVSLYFVLMFMMPPEMKEIPNGEAIIKKELTALGKIGGKELKLMIISILLLCFWVLEKKTFGDFGITGPLAKTLIHRFDTSSITVVAITIMFLPGINILTWEDAQHKLAWGTLFLFGIGISLGSAIIDTKAGVWLAKTLVPFFGLADASGLFILAVLAAFLIIIHLGFASATALAAAMIPIIISMLQEVKTPGINVIGMTMILQYVISFGFILPVNAPQNMIAYGTDTFSVKDFVRTGIPLTFIAYGLIMLLAATYWKWLGYV
ncbi:MAG: DASS family sodium-coupled anion symporter [Negativicutes bacterium]|nr:DASS family sodium-coupled anion symporter [Negativicutes bacterium]